MAPHSLFADADQASSDLDSFRSLCASDEGSYRKRLAAQPQIGMPQGRKLHGHGVFSHRLECLKPAQGSWRLRNEPLRQELVPGRVCAHELCAVDNCALHILDEVVVPAEAAAMVAHGRAVLSAEDEGSSFGGLAHVARSRRVDFLQSATHGSTAGHVLCLRVAERLRRVVATSFGLPLARLRLSEHFLTLRAPGPTIENPVHCDEAVFPLGESARGKWRFHFTSVLWLGRSGGDFEGGDLAFYNNATKPWLEVPPRVGRAAVFSSGWENIHGIKTVRGGKRWAFTAAFMVQEDDAPPRRREQRGRDFWRACVRPAAASSSSSSVRPLSSGVRGRAKAAAAGTSSSSEAYAECRQLWSSAMSSAWDREGDTQAAAGAPPNERGGRGVDDV